MLRMRQQTLDPQSLPWIPLGPGESFKPLRFLAQDRGRVLLLRVEPGTVIARHRHSGEVHAFNVSGQRRLDTGETIGPGQYVYEPPGNVDSWEAVGDEPVIIHITAYGSMDYLDDHGEVLTRDNAVSLRDVYLSYCREHDLEPLDLGGGAR